MVNRPVCIHAPGVGHSRCKNDHAKNSCLHCNCVETCPGNPLLQDQNSRGNSRGQLSSAPTPLRANSEVTIPRDGICILATKLHVLLVLPPDFDKPKKISEDKVYNVQVQFKQLTPKMREVYNCNFLGFLETAYWSKGRLQMHAMVRHATRSFI